MDMETRTFGPFTFDPTTGEIRNGDRIVRLPNQPARMLAVLTSRPGQLVTRQELRGALWTGDTFVGFDGCLNHCARRIRHALGDAADAPAYLETIPRRGYRFLATVEVAAPAAGVGARPGPAPSRRRPVFAAAALWVGLATGVVAGHVVEVSPWHGQVTGWLHQHIGPVPFICYWPGGDR
jgi:DNA-binding winged helix-turn-helix (wHTH) protein